MGLILSVVFVALLIAGLVYIIANDSIDALIAFVVSCLIGAFIPILVVAASYTSYVDIRTSYDATIKRYREAVTVYKDHVQIDVPKASLTDFKYEGYQNNIADFVRDLRRNVVRYNEKLISKRILDKNWFFGALIIAPDDDMKVINLSE
jgi:hypothetical protein